MSYGIDYGRNETNIDKETGIRFGVISTNEVSQAWCDDSEPIYPSAEDMGLDENDPEYDSIMGNLEAVGFTYIENGYKCYQGIDDSDIFVEKSPYFTYGSFCSPCAPGAIDLRSPIEVEQAYPGGAHDRFGAPLDNQRGYCFGPEWFKDEKAPYTIFLVETGMPVN